MSSNNKADNTSLSENEIAHWLALNQTPGIGALTFLRLIEYFGNAYSVFSANTNELRHLGLRTNTLRSLQKPDWHQVEQQQNWAAQHGNHIITSTSNAYPQLLLKINDPPPILFASGLVDTLKKPQIAVVGSRKPSPGGKLNAIELSHELGQLGLTITSGLAYGVDSLAHQGALNANAHTVAVLGSGLENIYPKRHQSLAHHIRENGTLVSELPPTAAPLSHHFPRRNRIISGLSLATLVIEASEKSGSLITAKLALEQGRDVMAVPGSIKNPMAAGCHQLINEGATLVGSAGDVVNNLNGFLLSSQIDIDSTPGETPLSIQPKLTPLQHKVLYSVDYDPTYIDNIVIQSGLTIEQVSSILLALELLGHVSSAAGGMYYRLID
ncbi:MAG: DNA-protecting protein DprA [Gammaproteobacteria bacterium]|nr:DNA-protecting protein DprA [Gammaproteobacteria bacterium]